MRQRVVNDQQIERWVFGGTGIVEGRRRAEARLREDVKRVDRICGLTHAQREKLTLAGRGDIKRYFDRVEEIRQTFRRGPIDAMELRALSMELRFASLDAGPYLFGSDSLFAKCIRRALTPEQLDGYRRALAAELMVHHGTAIKSLVDNLDSALRLTREQHRRLEDLLILGTRPAARYGRYDYYGVLIQLSKLDAKRVRPIFDDDQWTKLTREFAGAATLEPFLRASGYLPDDPAALGAAGRRPSGGGPAVFGPPAR
jgi:hypothetical protein